MELEISQAGIAMCNAALFASSSGISVKRGATAPTPKYSRKQRTLEQGVSLSGIGVFSGQTVSLEILPAALDSGIIFERSDLPNTPRISACLARVEATPRCTILGEAGVHIQTVEHVLSALYGLGIDNALIRLRGVELPIGDGSARLFVEAITRAGIKEVEAFRPIYSLQEPVFLSKGDMQLIALPSQEFRVSYTLHYPHSRYLQSQFYSFALDRAQYIEQIAPCRTFCLYEEIAPLIEKGFIRGGGLDRAVVIKDDGVMNPDGVRFFDEMVRHKILDILGDLSLMGISFLAHIIAIRSGHAANIEFARLLLNQIKMENA